MNQAKRTYRRRQAKTGMTHTMEFSPRQKSILEQITKQVGIAEYINNLIRCDLQDSGLDWPTTFRRKVAETTDRP